MDKLRTLEDLPKRVKAEEDGNTEICRQEFANIPVRVMFAHEDIESVEDDDDGEENERSPGGIWLEFAFEYKGVSVNPLGLERVVETQIRNAYGAPGEEGRNGGQVLEPLESGRGTSRSNR